MKPKHKKKYDATRSEEGEFHEDMKESWIKNEKITQLSYILVVTIFNCFILSI